MTTAGSFVDLAAQVGLQSVAISPLPRRIYNVVQFDGSGADDIIAQAVIDEEHSDEMEVTAHPVETGAPITDHAFVRPSHLVLTLMWSSSPPVAQSLANTALGITTAELGVPSTVVGAIAASQASLGYTSNQQGAGVQSITDAYATLLKLMQTRSLFSVITGKRVYNNMICKSLRTGTDAKRANSLTIRVECQQVFLVNTSVTPLPANLQRNPQDTASLIYNGSKALVPAPQGAGILK